MEWRLTPAGEVRTQFAADPALDWVENHHLGFNINAKEVDVIIC
ncbi:hypothetical protein [Desulfonatronum parangueonense]